MDNTNPTSGAPVDLRTATGGATQTGGAVQTGGAQPAKTGAPGAGTASSATGAPGADQSVFSKFEIPHTVREQYPDLISLILSTESMTDEERQYWFQILPIMTAEQVGKLREILTNEKQQLAALDREYQDEMKKINAKHVTEWKEFEAKEKRQKLQAAEGSVETKEKQEEEGLLKKLQEL